MTYAEIVAAVRKQVQAGLSLEDTVKTLRESGLSITESMKALMELFGMSLGEAKRVTAEHPAWADVFKAVEPLHDELEAIMKMKDEEQ